MLVALAASTGAVGLTSNHASDFAIDPVDAYGVALPRQVEFGRQIQPILVARCMPCHFPGGSMYERLPFDQPTTIHTLGEKLFPRIKDENERRLIREFLAQRL